MSVKNAHQAVLLAHVLMLNIAQVVMWAFLFTNISVSRLVQMVIMENHRQKHARFAMNLAIDARVQIHRIVWIVHNFIISSIINVFQDVLTAILKMIISDSVKHAIQHVLAAMELDQVIARNVKIIPIII